MYNTSSNGVKKFHYHLKLYYKLRNICTRTIVRKKICFAYQTPLHGDEGRAEDQQQDSDLDDAGRIPGRSQDSRGVSEFGAQQIDGRTRCGIIGITDRVGPLIN